MHVVVVEWLLSLKATGDDEQGNQLTRKPRLLFTTRDIATKRTNDGSWQSFIESRGEKKNERRRRRIENNRNVVVVVEVEGKQ